MGAIGVTIKGDQGGRFMERLTDRIDSFPKKVEKQIRADMNKLKTRIAKKWFKATGPGIGVKSKRMAASWRVQTVRRQSSVRFRIYSTFPYIDSYTRKITIKPKKSKHLSVPVKSKTRFKSARNDNRKLQYIKLRNPASGPNGNKVVAVLAVKKVLKSTRNVKEAGAYLLYDQIKRPAYLKGIKADIYNGMRTILSEAANL